MKVRIVASTNIDLSAAMNDSKFREDLFYRLDEIRLVLPPLRDREDDVILLAENFLEEFGRQYTLGKRTLSETSKELLRQSTGRETFGNSAMPSNAP